MIKVNMPLLPEVGMFSLLPEPKSRWREFVFGYGSQSVAIAILLSIGILRPQILTRSARELRSVTLVSTPAPVNHQPAPIRAVEAPRVVAQLHSPIPDNLRLTAPRPKPAVPDESAPKIQMPQAEPAKVVNAKPVIPRQLVRTNVFSTGSSAAPTMATAPAKVQTGGFGDPNGVPATEDHGKPVNIAQVGSFDLPGGPGSGNGTGGSRGVRGVVSSAGFGNGVASGDDSGRASASRGTVRQGGFGDADAPLAQQLRKPVVNEVAKKTPVEIISKPTPTYTDEARKLRIEGEVLLEVMFEASGRLRVLRVVRGLGHGLDENAQRAAEQIRFKPAMKDGQPADSTATVHIIFQLA
jgi:TonB family protein